MTAEAREALQKAEVIVGYETYTALLRPLFPGKEYRESGMRRERERCREALELTAAGRETALVCSGDAVIYGMAGLVWELREKEWPEVPMDIRVVPGITAAIAASALLGAAFGHDGALISLSDLMTPWELIEKRLRAAAAGDFCIALYNPGSHGRKEHLGRACRILMETIEGQRPCGIASHIGREGEALRIVTLEEMAQEKVDMQTICLIGNSHTGVVGGKLVTPRGY